LAENWNYGVVGWVYDVCGLLRRQALPLYENDAAVRQKYNGRTNIIPIS
jgi:hypothetical protein